MKIIGKKVTVTVDRPIGSAHPNYPSTRYPINYGYINGIVAPDGDFQDAYILGVENAIDVFEGKVIAIIHRTDDTEDKWVVAAGNKKYTKEQISKQVEFQEKYFSWEIIM